MRVVVTGGAGRLGRSVVEVLASHDHEVVSVDLEDRSQPADRREISQVTGDLTVPGEADRVVGRIRPQAVVHLAAIPVPFSRPEAEILRTNVMLAFDVCRAAVDHGAAVVVAASSPTVIGYGNPRGWTPAYLPIDEEHPVAPWHAYAVSKVATEHIVGSLARQVGERTRLAAVRPCFVVSPEEWAGAPTQVGDTIRERLDDPSLAAVSLFNYVDARDVAELIGLLLSRPSSPDAWPNGEVFFAGAADALAREPLAELLPRLVPSTASAAGALAGTSPAFDCGKAECLLDWKPTRSWRTELESVA